MIRGVWRRVGFVNVGVAPAIYRKVPAVREIEALRLGLPSLEIILFWVTPLGVTVAARLRKEVV